MTDERIITKKVYHFIKASTRKPPNLGRTSTPRIAKTNPIAIFEGKTLRFDQRDIRSESAPFAARINIELWGHSPQDLWGHSPKNKPNTPQTLENFRECPHNTDKSHLYYFAKYLNFGQYSIIYSKMRFLCGKF